MATSSPDRDLVPATAGLPDASTLAERQLAMVFDGTCGFCSATARRMDRWDWRGAIVWIPSQAEGLAEATGLSIDETAAAAWAITPAGRYLRGAASICAALDAFLPGGPPCLSTLYRLPGLRQLADAAYAWVAANRHRIPGAPACGLNRTLPPLAPAVAAELRRRREARP
jgi:predicted DCC family thiol-disulfide oxidoreductase YuxK